MAASGSGLGEKCPVHCLHWLATSIPGAVILTLRPRKAGKPTRENCGRKCEEGEQQQQHCDLLASFQLWEEGAGKKMELACLQLVPLPHLCETLHCVTSPVFWPFGKL